MRPSLGQLAATTPIHGTFDVTSNNTQSEEEQSFQGKANVGFEVSLSGLKLLYPKASLAQSNQEARAETLDPDRQTPARSGMTHVHVELIDLLDAAATLQIEL